MKKTVVFFSLILISIITYAKKVEPADAEKLALSFYYENVSQFKPIDIKNLSVASVITEYSGSIAIYYIVNINPSGYVIVSADDNVLPVIAYSYESQIEPSKIPAAMYVMLDAAKQSVEEAITMNLLPDANISTQWNYYLNTAPEALNINKAKAIDPLVTANWDQGKYYNQYCPAATGGPDDKALVGCVATAMGMVMYYYRYPVTGQGSHGGINFGTTTYKWDNMLDALGNYNDGVATLLYHCGKAVDMNYGATGSSANTTTCPSVLKNYFKYNTSVSYASKYTYTQTNWENMLKTNLDAKHPMIYSGMDLSSAGHAWVCDGYQTTSGTNYFHMNWGWSGYANGFFATTSLAVAGSDFTTGQGAVRNIYPASSYPSNCSGTKNITYTTGTIEDGSGLNNYDNNKDCMWLIDPTETVSKITVFFTQFNTEATNDVVTIYDGSTTSAPVLGTFSGSTLPSQVISTGPTVLVRFTTNGSTTSSGWMLQYNSSFPQYCSGITTLTDQSGTISDGSGTDNYSYNHLCRWQIQPTGATAITVSFLEFNVASTDFVKITNLENNATLDQFTGTSLPPVKTYNTSKIMFLFKSDNYQNAGGFSMQYTAGQAGIGEQEINGISVYPNPASTAINLEFIVNENKNLSLQLLSATGKMVYNEEKTVFQGQYKTSIQTNGLAAGIYFLRIVDETQAVTKKIIIE